MKKIVSLLVCLITVIGICCAEPATPGETAFDNAKQSIQFAAGGDYAAAAKLMQLPYETDAVKSMLMKYFDGATPETVNTVVAVAWLTDNVWKLAVPIALPHDNMFPAFVYTMADAEHASALEIQTWRWVETEYKHASQILWNQEYNPGFIVVVD